MFLVNYRLFSCRCSPLEICYFADNTNAIISTEDIEIETLTNKLNLALAHFHSWFTINTLNLNTGKTNAMQVI